MIPWEESAIHQEANYRLLRWAAVVVTVGVAVFGLYTGDWSYFGYWILGLGIFFLALVVYAGIIWSVARLVVLAVRVFKRVFHREH